MPFLSIVRSPCCETRSPTQRFSLSTQKRRYCRFGKNRRWVLLLAWETWFPCCGFLPVTSHTRAIMQLQNSEEARFYTNSGFCPTVQRLNQPAFGKKWLAPQSHISYRPAYSTVTNISSNHP